MSKSIVFVDCRVADYPFLIDSLNEPADVFILDFGSDGLSQIAANLHGQTGIDAIHIISHGSSGGVSLGNSLIDRKALTTHTVALATIGQALTESGDILLYGCNVAAGDAGVQFIGSLAQATGADVAASTGLTGAAELGGNWVLEAEEGAIAADVAVAANAQQDYGHVLGISHYVLAQMAELAYEGSPSFADWDARMYSAPGAPGFFAVMFSKGKDIVIAFRGTDTDSTIVSDLPADLAIAADVIPYPFNWDAQFGEAIAMAAAIRNTHDDANIYVTGHSLGGALAQVVSEMFGCSGATFDPGGATNIVESDEFGDAASDLKIQPVGYPEGFINYVVYGSPISEESGPHVGEQFTLNIHPLLTSFLLTLDAAQPGLPGRIVADGLEMWLLHPMAGIKTLMQAFESNTSEPLQKQADLWYAAAATGDLGVSSEVPGQGALDFYGSDARNYLYANNSDNTIYGYAGDDVIYGFEGDDTVYGGDGNETISTAQGNDAIDAGSGNDTIYAGSGDDVIDAGRGRGDIDGGGGFDTLSFDLSDQFGQLRLDVGLAEGGYQNFYGSSASFDSLRTALTGATSFAVRDYYENANVGYRNVEAVNWTAG
ncbi:MAG: DUF4347 domain-containing protein, partial [Candidatus Accumulibacter meliphilus]